MRTVPDSDFAGGPGTAAGRLARFTDAGRVNKVGADDGPLALTIPADTTTTASVAIGASVNGDLETVGDNDWYRVDLVAGQSYVFNLNATSGAPNSDPFLELRNPSGQLIAIDDDAGAGLNSQLRFTVQTSGTYFLNARSFVSPEQPATAFTYTLSAAFGPPQDPLRALDLGFTVPGGPNFTVYFATTGEVFDGETATRGWTANEISQAMAAFGTYAAIIPRTFTQTFNSAGATFIMSLADLEAGTLGQASRSGGVGFLAFDPLTTPWTSGLAPGGLGFVTLIHEIGHGLGLAHPHDNSGNSEILQGVTSEFDSFGTFELNQGVFTTMTYNDGWPLGGQSGATATRNQATPMALDIAVLHQKYGANATTGAGDTTYVLPGTQGSFRTIWDASGIDTISTTDTSDATIDLRPATLLSEIGGGGFVSSVQFIGAGFTIAAGAIIENASGGSGNDLIIGNAVANLLLGNNGNDTLRGMGGADTLDGGAGFNVLDGGAGDDRFLVRSASESLIDASGFDEVVLLFSGITSYTLATGFEILNFSSSANLIVANGNSVDNLIFANAIDSELHGHDGNDQLFGSVGNNRLEGGNGIDLLFGSDGNDALFGQIGNDRLEGEAGNDLFFAGEGDDVVIGGTGDDQAFGENGIDLLFGGSGADILLGEFGNDRLFGEFDADLLFGGVGDDEMQGEQGDDRLFGDVGADIMFGQDGADEMQGENDNDRLFGGFGQDIMFGQAGDDEMQGEQDNDRLFGGFGADIMFGQAGNDEMQGEQDNDRLFGGTGQDILFGQDGNDELQGEEDNDRLFGGTGADTLFGQAGADELQGEEDNDQLFGGEGTDTLVGGAGDDTLRGDAAADALSGGTGADRLIGGTGGDVLTGGANGDFFVFASGSGADQLTDFQDGLDLLDLRSYAGATFANTTIVQQGGDTLVTFFGGESVLLVGVSAATVTDADFLFI